MSPAPRWLLALVLAAFALVATLLWAETQRWRPFYASGDESIHIRSVLAIEQGEPMHWRWARGDLQRNAQYAWWRLTGSGPGRLAQLGLLVFAAELVLLALVAGRWIGPSGAAWALLADLVCADTWMRARSALAFHWLPAQLLLLAWLSGKVRARWAAVLWAVAAGCLVMDYEGALLALPGLLAACLAYEEGLRKRWAWVLGAFGGTVAAVMLLEPKVVGAYTGLRRAVNWGEGVKAVAKSWAVNLWQLLTGGDPMPYFSVRRWPAFALWALPLLALGAVLAWRDERRRWWLFWAALAVLASQATLSPYGVPAHRLAAAWPALCLMAALGGVWLQERLGRRTAWWLALLLALGAAAEANAYFRHMAIFGERYWGRSRNMGEAAALLARAAPGASLDSALLEARYPDLAFHVRPHAGGGKEAWVLLPPEYRVLAPAQGQALVLHHGVNDEPVLLMRVQGAAVARFDAMEADLRRLLPIAREPERGQPQEQAWLRRPGHDDWALWLVVMLDLRHYYEGMGLDPMALALFKAHPPLTPAPWAVLGRASTQEAGADGLRLLDKALALDPNYLPALLWKADGLKALGRLNEASAARDLAEQRQRQGAWMVGE